MARIAGVNIPKNKRVEIGLTYIKGVGLTTSQKLLATAGVDPNTRVKDLTEAEANKIREALDATGMKLEGDLRRDVLANIKRLKEIGSYRGNRHARRLPSRGQRTKTNNRTLRGNVRATAGSGRVKAAAKT